MAVVFKNQDKYKGRTYPFFTPPTQIDVFGYKITNAQVGDVIVEGTPLVADTDTHTATIAKHAYVTKKISTTEFEVENVGYLKVGEKYFCSGAESATVSEIAAIDVVARKITLKAANAKLAEGKVMVQSVDGSTAKAAAPNRIVARTQELKSKDQTVSATYQAVVIKNVVRYAEEWLNKTLFPGSTLLVGDPLILFMSYNQ